MGNKKGGKKTKSEKETKVKRTKKPWKASGKKAARGKMKRGPGPSKDKLDQHGRLWPTARTGRNEKGRRGKRGVSSTEWQAGLEGGKFTEPKRNA